MRAHHAPSPATAHTLRLNRGVRLTSPGGVRAVLLALALRYFAGEEVTVTDPAGQPYLCLTVPTRKEH